MPDQRPGPVAEHEVPAHVMSWWIDMLEGEQEGSHPLFGNHVQAKLEGQTLVVTGALPSDAGWRNLERELRLVTQQRRIAVRNDTTVAPEGAERSGLLDQTLVAIYEQPLHARMAVEQVEGNPLLGAARLQLLDPDSAGGSGTADAASRQHVAASYQGELRRALAAGRAVVVATVDETDAFALRQLLDEETRSLQVLVMPPILAAAESRLAMTSPSADQ